MKIRVLELFGGIGACTKALKRLGIDVEIVDYVEIDKYAVSSYNAINDTNFEPQDITTWDKDVEVDLIMHGSPFQDFSVAGKQAGGDIGSGTRSSLMYETIRIVGKLRPKYVIWENVKNLLSEKHRHNFDAYLETMKSLGYTNYYQVLNAKDYGIPQNRERVFTVSILGNGVFEFPQNEENVNKVINPLKNKTQYGWHFEQAVYDVNGLARALKAGGGSGNIPKVIEKFEFPPKQELKIRLKDILDDTVEEKFYLNNAQIERMKTTNFECNKFEHRVSEEEGIVPTLCARDYKDPKCVRIGGIFDTEKSKHQAGSIWDKEQLAPTLDTMQGGWRQPSIIDTNFSRKREYTEYSPTIDTYANKLKVTTVQKDSLINNDYRIRKLTPKECWRLMGFDDADFEKAAKVNSNSQLYKQAGNSIVVNVLEEIFRVLLLGETKGLIQNKLFRLR